MADNTRINVGTTGDLIATDDVGGVKYQRVKVAHGVDGSATDTSSAAPLPVRIYGDSGPQHDAFGRWRVSNPGTLFDSKLVYDSQPLYWTESLGAGCSSSHSATDARMRLTVAAGTTAIRQTKRYFTYQPGKSQQILVTFNLHGAAANVTKRVGYFDGSNGVFLELAADGTPSFVRRSGSSVTTSSKAQSEWNLDTMDGNGASGVSLDFSKTQILFIDLEWLGVGSVRCGFVVAGEIIYAHAFHAANVETAVYMSTPNLPVRYEIASSGALSTGNPYMDCICSTVVSEGGQDRAGTRFGYVRTTATGNVATTASAPVLSMRLNGSYPRATLRLIDFAIMSSGASNIAWSIVLNGTLTGATFATTVGTYVDVDIAATAISGGTTLAAGLVSSVARADFLALAESYLTLASDVAGTTLDTLSLVATNLSAGNETYRGALNWSVVT